MHLELEILAQVVGWGYFVSWTLSFYPQLYLNWKRKSVVGFSFDFLALNALGYTAYSIYTVTLFSDSTVEKYFHSLEHQSSSDRDNTVKLSDVVFATHGLAIVLLQIYQVCVYDRGTQRLSKVTGVICGLSVIALLVFVIIALSVKTNPLHQWALSLLYCGYVKTGASFVKSIPQVYLNAKRKSTEGFPIAGVWGDFVGGVLSLLQMLVYCVIDKDNAQLTGNPPKLALAVESLLFDVIFIFQHYIFFVKSNNKGLVEEGNEKKENTYGTFSSVT